MKTAVGRTAGAALAVAGVVAAVWATLSHPLPMGALLVGTALLLALRDRPRAALVLWLASIAFIPPWVGVDTAGFISAHTALGAIILVATLGRRGWRPHAADLTLVGVILIGGAAAMATSANTSVWTSTITYWLVAYLVGKILTIEAGFAFTAKAIALAMSAVAALSVVEFVTDWHPFVPLAFDNILYETWSPVQERGGLPRSEWSFGHSIALGGALTIAVPFVIVGRFRVFTKVALLAILAAGTVLTFSRASMGAFVIALAFSALFLGALTVTQKLLVSMTGIITVAFVVPLISRVFEEAGSEAAFSSAYRGGLLGLIPTLQPVGPAGGTGHFTSIDNAFLYLALSLGWVVALIVIIPFVAIIVRAALRRAGAAEVALLAQVALLITVAPITQWQMMVAFAGGVAVASATLAREAAPVPASRADRTARLRAGALPA